jgi:hypothetical protein
MLAALSVVGLPVAVSAQGSPSIEILNPSGYSTNMELSSKTDVDGAYHFVAWVPEVPPSPFVEFELQPAAGISITIEATRVGTDTFEAFHNLSGLSDGAYTLRAILFSGQEQFGAGDSRTVTINNANVPPPPQSETVEILHPTNGGQIGFFNPPSGRPNTMIDVKGSTEAQQARLLYSVSRPGTEPAWTECGAAEFDSTDFGRGRCTLAENVAPSQVTAVAAVANMTPPPAPPGGPADDAGDAHRVFPYLSVPASVAIEPESQTIPVATCSPVLRATALDQFGRPLANPNFDVHAFGPSDQLQFATISGTTDNFQGPDKGPHSQENTARCSETAAEGRQGETNRVAQHDEKHIESRGEFRDEGVFKFALRSDSVGGTNVLVWVDADDDDLQDGTEASGGARIGWGQDPPPPVRQVFLDPANPSATVGSCVRLVLSVKEGGSPLTSGNADVHLTGPDSTVSFCTPPDGSVLREPDSGEHVAGVHADGTRHAEGELNSAGQLVFGVMSTSQGQTTVTAWLDETDDDTLSNEPAASTRVSFGVDGDRAISLDASRRRVPRNARVRLSGVISGSEACEGDQPVRFKARRPGTNRFRTIASRATNAQGEFAIRTRVRRTTEYRAVAPRNGVCNVSKSRIVRVRAT